MKGLVDIHVLAEHLGCTVNTLYSWVSQKKVPYVKIGRLVRFDMVDIDQWVVSNKVEEAKF